MLASENDRRRTPRSKSDYDALGAQLARRGIDIEAITAKVAELRRRDAVLGRRHRRHALRALSGPRRAAQHLRQARRLRRHPPADAGHADRLAAHSLGQGRRREELQGQGRCARPRLRRGELQHLSRTSPARRIPTSSARSATPMRATRAQASNTTSNASRSARRSARKALTVWIGDGSNFPGQQQFHAGVRALSRRRWRRSTRRCPTTGGSSSSTRCTSRPSIRPSIQDWGTNYMIAQTLGPKAFCLVDLGHHAPNINIEMIVARLIQFGKLGGFHFNDSKYGDDDLDAGAIDPYRLFLVFNELVEAERRGAQGLPSRPHDRPVAQRHRPDREPDLQRQRDRRAYAQALIVDRKALSDYQDGNDALMASETLKRAYRSRCRADPRRGPAPRRRRDRSGGRLPCQRLSQEGLRRSGLRPRPAVAASSDPASDHFSTSAVGSSSTVRACTSSARPARQPLKAAPRPRSTKSTALASNPPVQECSRPTINGPIAASR